MGLGTSKRKFISNDEIDRISSSNKTLEKLYSYIKGYDGYITKRDFELIFNKKLSTKISNKLYKIFSTEKDKFFFDDLKYFYALMLTKLVQPKIYFFSELIFGEKSIKHVDRYTYRVGLIFPQEWKNKLTSKEFISKICDKGNTNKISKENFIKFMGSFYDIPLASFEFLKNFNLSNANKNNFRKFDKHKISFACDCYSQLDSKSSQKSFNDLNDFIYDKMETEFRRMEKLNDGLFTIQMFDKILTDLEVNSKLISPISLYLKRKTQRNFIDFKTLKMFLLSFIGGADARIKILFQVLSFPKEYIDKKVLFALIKSLLPNNSVEYISLLKDSFDSFQDQIFWDKFLTLFTQNTILYQILNYLDRINYIPYLYFKVRPEDKLDQKGCIEILTKGEKDLKKVIETLISNDNENDFYCVNYEFWETWCNYVQWDVNCKEVNPETNHVKTLKISNEKILGKFSAQINKELIYFKDFVVFPSKIYEIFTRWYAISGGEIKVKKICYKSFKNSNQKNLSLNENNLNNDKNFLLFKKNEHIMEIDLYPIFSKHFTFDELLKNINEISIDSTKALLKNLYESNLNLTRILQFSRKTYFKDIKTQLEIISKINKPTNLWVFYKSEFYKCDENKTLEEDNIEDFCLLVLENYKDNEWSSEFISRMSKKNLKLEQENLIKEQQSTNKIPQLQPVPSSSGFTSTSTKESNNNSSHYKNKTSIGYIDPSLIGIQNIGNTCYMNSVLQSLLNLDIIQRVFMNKNFKYFINYKNKFGFKGRLIREFVNLISEKWSDSEKHGKSLRPVQFKEIVGEINPQFKNKDQQDAQEFISFLLDVLHEEINLKSEKEYIANPEMYDYTEEELATEYWANNMRRNVSFVHSIFLGQMKSTLECEACGSNKISFETFSNLILPIPQKKTINLEVVFFRLPFTYKAYYIDKFIDKNLHVNYNSNFSGEINVKKSLNNIRKNSLEVNEILTQEEFEPNEKYLKMKGDRVKDSSNSSGENLYTSKLTTAIPLKLVLNIDRKSKVENVISMLKEIKELELEVNHFNNENELENEKNQSNTTESKFCNTNKKYSQRENKNISNSPPNYTTYVIMSGTDNTFIDQDLKIDECFQNDQLIYIYELLNTYGINKIMNSEKDFNSISEEHKKRKNSQDKGFNISNYESNTCLTQNKTNYSSTSVSLTNIPVELGLLTQKYHSPDLDPQEFGKFIPLNYDSINKFYKSNLLERQLNENYMEYLVQILHRYPIETKDAYLFRKESFLKLEGFLNILLLNNFTNFTARYLYDYIWEKYEYILNDPTKVKSNLWWVNGEKEYSSSKKEKYIKEENIENYESSKISNSNGLEYKTEDKDNLKSKNFALNVDKLKMCNPFVIKILNKENNACIRCPWYNFCTGCILDPLSYPDAPLLISPSSVIVVEWCHQIVKKEMNENNLRLILNHESVKSKEEEKKSKSLEECLNLFLEKEYLEEDNQMIHCSRCKTSRNFFKKYDFDRMPPVLILNIKRFKFAKMYKKKIDNLIEFPIYDLELKGFKYDLYSVINHTGVLSAGHYTSITKINNKWIKCDDASCYEIEENSIVSSGAYILIYKLKESIETDYLKMMNSLLNNFDFHDLNNLKNSQTFYYRNKNNYAGEPVKTPYGRGFIQKEILFENNKNYCVKFRYGYGYLNEKSINKEILLHVYPQIIMSEEKKLFLRVKQKTKKMIELICVKFIEDKSKSLFIIFFNSFYFKMYINLCIANKTIKNSLKKYPSFLKINFDYQNIKNYIFSNNFIMSIIYWNENFKRLLDLQITINSKDQDLYQKIFDSESLEKLVYHNYEVYSKYYQQDIKNFHKISKFICSIITSKPIIERDNSELNEKKNYVDYILLDIQKYLGKLIKETESSTKFLNESRKQIIQLEELKLSFDCNFHSLYDNLVCQSHDSFSEENINGIVQDCFEKGQQYLKEYNLLVNYLNISTSSIANSSLPLINKLKNKYTHLSNLKLQLIMKFDEVYKRNVTPLNSFKNNIELKLSENLNNFDFIGNKRNKDLNETNNLLDLKETKSQFQQENLQMTFSKLSDSDRKEISNFNSILSPSTEITNSLNKVSTLKNLKVKIPNGSARKNSEVLDKQSYIGEDSKFPKVIDNTKEEIKEFINLLKEVNKQDLSIQDKQRMDNYLSKSISDLQKKISSDLQKMNGNNP